MLRLVGWLLFPYIYKYIYNDKWDFICNPVLTQGKLSVQYLSQYGDDV